MPKPVPIFLSPSNAKLLESLWNEHSGAVHSMLIAYCGNPDDAGDILQDLFLRLSRDPSTLAAMKSPRAFLNVSARRLAIDLARKRAADQRRQASPEAVAHFHPAPAPPQADKDLGNIIRIALQKLPADQRAVAEARLFHGKTLALIAEEQGIPLNTVASRLRYSLDKLRDELRPHYEHMKNPNAQSSERLIKTLEPKRVPSVAPGLEGVAACAVFDHVDEAPVIAPCVEWDHQTETDSEICVFPPPEELAVDTRIHVDPVPELPITGTAEEYSDETGDHVDSDPEIEILPTDEEHSDETGEHVDSDPEIAILPTDEEHSDESGEHVDSDPEIAILPTDEVHSDESGEHVDSDPEIAILPTDEEHSDESGEHVDSDPEIAILPTDEVHSEETGKNVDGDPEVVLTCLFEGQWEDLNDHHDLWEFDQAHVKFDPPLPFERVFALGDSTAHLTLNGGTPDISGAIHFATPPAVNEGALSLSGDSHFEGQTLVTGGSLVVNEPITAQVQVLNGGHLSAADKSFGEGNYEFSNSHEPVTIEALANGHAQVSPIESASPVIASPVSHAQHHGALSANHGTVDLDRGNQSSDNLVNVSASNSPIASFAVATALHGEPHEIAPIAESDLPASITTFHMGSTPSDEAADDIVFIDEAPEASHEHTEFSEPSDSAAPVAAQAASTALAGAFVLGSTAQAPSVRGNPSRLNKTL